MGIRNAGPTAGLAGALVVMAGCFVPALAGLAGLAGLAETPAGPSSELRQAVAIGDAFLATLAPRPGAYRLVAAQNAVDGARYRGPHFWRLAYQACPEAGGKPAPPCKGGELFIAVNLAGRSASLLGVGE